MHMAPAIGDFMGSATRPAQVQKPPVEFEHVPPAIVRSSSGVSRLAAFGLLGAHRSE